MLVVDRIAGIPTKLVGEGEDLGSVSDRMDPNEFRIVESHGVSFVPLINTKR